MQYTFTACNQSGCSCSAHVTHYLGRLYWILTFLNVAPRHVPNCKMASYNQNCACASAWYKKIRRLLPSGKWRNHVIGELDGFPLLDGFPHQSVVSRQSHHSFKQYYMQYSFWIHHSLQLSISAPKHQMRVWSLIFWLHWTTSWYWC